MDRPTLLVIPPHLGPVAGLFAADYEILKLWEGVDEEALGRVQAIITAGEFELARSLTDAMPRLGLVACIGVGYDGIDLAWARARGVRVTAALDVNNEDVADHALGMIIASRRRILDGHNTLVGGGWTPESRIITPSLNGQKLGVVGLGGIGRALAARAGCLALDVRWWGPRLKPGCEWERMESVAALAAWCDILAVCAKATEETRGLIDAPIIEAVGPEGLLVNVSRGQVVDEDALLSALKSGRLGAAALDVYQQEPTPPERWRDAPNLIATPHIAGGTREAVQKMIMQMSSNLKAFFAGEPLTTPVDL